MVRKKKNVDNKAKPIVITATKLICQEIWHPKLSLDSYPSQDGVTDSVNKNGCWKPNLLNTFLSSDSVKKSSMCQCILITHSVTTSIIWTWSGVWSDFRIIESHWMSRAKDIKSDGLVKNERITMQKYVHPDKPTLLSIEIKPLFRFNHQLFSRTVM